MNKDMVAELLETNSNTLNELVKTYFIYTSQLDQVIIGNYNFKDIYHNFLYSLREYSITHSVTIQPSDFPPCRTLLKLNSISIQDLKELIVKVNQHLESHTDIKLVQQEKRDILEKQIREFTDRDIYDDIEEEVSKTVKYKMISKLIDTDEFQTSKKRYLDSVIKAMKEAEINQLCNNKYLIVDKLLTTYYEFLSHMNKYGFKNKRDYLKKLNNDEKVQILKSYIKEMIEDNVDSDIKTIRWFIYYLIYGANKVDIFMIHYMIGYKYKNATKFYTKLFCKDHSTGRSTDFLYDFNFLDITEDSLRSTKELFGSVKLTEDNVAKIKKRTDNNEHLSYRIVNNSILIEDASDCYDKPIYTTIAHYI